MKTSNFKKLLTFTFALLLSVATFNYANAFADKAVEKAREAVENASPDDWHTLAKSADKLIRKNKNLKEAHEWIEKSIEIKPTVYNLTIKGDYYMANRLPDDAVKFYVKAMNMAKNEDNHADVSDLQNKIANITNIGGINR